jgi:outer membrane protein assembly factor BamB
MLRSRTLTLVAAGVLLAGCGGPTTPPPPTTSPAPRIASPVSPSASTNGLLPVPTSLPAPSLTPTPSPTPTGPFPGGLLIADRGNGRLIVVDNAGRIVWHFPVTGSLPAGQAFSADDAFVSPDGRMITANDEDLEVVVRIDIATRRVIWEYGHYGLAGSAPGYLNTPDDAYPLANGDVVVADIRNCRVIEIAPDKRIRRQWGRTGACVDHPPATYDEPNGNTPLPDGGILITEIRGPRVVRLDAAGNVVFAIHVPAAYPSDAQLDAQGNVVVSDYANPGAVIAIAPTGRVVWRYGPPSGPGRLDHPSLAVPRADGSVVLNDDLRDRVLLLDPSSGRLLWQYGVTDQPGSGPGHLSIPDGLDQLPPGVILGT